MVRGLLLICACRPMLSEADAYSILQMLISWLVKLSTRNDSKLAVEKLTATLVTYFVRASALWHRPLASLTHAVARQDGQVDGRAETVSFGSYNQQQLLVLLDFATELATELDRANYNAPAQ